MEFARILSERYSERLLPNTIAQLIAAAFGIFGNSLVLLMYSRYVKDKTASRFFIPILAFVDLAGCVSNVTEFHIDNTMRYIYPSEILCKTLSFLIILTGGMSAHLIFTIALQRYLIICRPFGPQMSTKSCKIATLIIFLISVGYSAPILKFSGIYRPSSLTMCHFDDGSNGNSVMIPYFGTFLILSFINIIVTSALYIPVIKTIYKTLSLPKQNRTSTIQDDGTDISSKETQDVSVENIAMVNLPPNIVRTHNTEPPNTLTTDGNREQRARRNISVMFLVIIIVYVVSYLTSLVTQVYTFVNPTMVIRGFKLNVYYFCLRFNLLNHIANPYIYWFFDNKFRNELRKICCEKIFRRYSFSL
ncbi:cholecystokinin receptor type A-like [Saccostrea echinata]|uniref:cholecystokinin receptor type A-like n=1 Tax=Saccostrea echinata TaxID=191078 RepID=UPI002A809884|nr:cholecystokinin receptor type A-like [Saccostrea echinata]